jgi:hypothetical protein
VELLNRPVFTLYGVVGSSEAQQRADFIKERLDLLLKKYAEEPITIQAGVLAGEAQVLVNNQPLVTITQNDLRANGSKQALGLARQWALALKQNIGRNEVQDSYFTYAGLPSNVSIGDEQYSLVRQTVNDYGLFTTDGSQHNNRVIFWREGEVLPRKAVYLLNSRRQFVVYQRLTPPG